MSEAKKEEGEPKKKSKLPLIIIIVVVLLVVGGAGAYFLLGSSAKKEEEHEIPDVFAMIEMEPFYVNLGDNESFLKAVIGIQYNSTLLEKRLHELHEGADGGHGGGGSGGGDAGPVEPPIFKEKRLPLRDAVIRVLSSKGAADVLTVDGKELLKEELLESLNEALGLDEDIFTQIFFVEFLVQ